MHFMQRTCKQQNADESLVMKLIGTADVKRWEEEKDRVNFYFEELSTRRQCVGFLVVQETEVENPASAIVRVYDYYQKEISVSAVSSSCLALLDNEDNSHFIFKCG
jgi:hypothetical protein